MRHSSPERVTGVRALPLSLVAVLFLTHISFSGHRFALTLQAISLHATPFQIGMILASLMAGPMLLAVKIGKASDQYGYAPVAAAGLALVLCGAIAVCALPILPMLYVASVLSGTGFMAVHIAVNNAIGKVTELDNRTGAFSAVALAYSASQFFAPLLTGAIMQVAGYRVPYLVLIGFTAAAAIALRIASRTYKMTSAPMETKKATNSFDLLKNKNLRSVFMTGALFSMGWDLFTFFAPIQGVRAGLGPAAAGAIVSALAVGMFSVRLVVPGITRHFGEWRVVTGSLVLVSSVFLVFPLLHTFSTLMVAACVLGVGLGCGQPVSMTLLYQAAPRDRNGEAVGVRSTITSVTQTVFPILIGGLGAAVGMIAVFWSTAALLTGGAWVASQRARTEAELR